MTLASDRLLGGLALALLALSIGCGAKVEGLSIAEPDRAMFEQEVFPILLRDCGFHACHGSTQRFFQVFGPGRGRLLPEVSRPLDLTTPEEMEHSYQRARSMINPSDPFESPLVRKPLSITAGGSGHEGIDSFGRDVYESVDDPSYATLKRWVATGATF